MNDNIRYSAFPSYYDVVNRRLLTAYITMQESIAPLGEC